MKNGFIIFFLTVLLPEKGLRATITQGPSNAVAENGGQVKLNCAATDLIGYWYLSKNGVTTSEVAVAGPGCSVRPAYVDHYAVESLGGGNTCNLIIFNITMAQAGVYRCLETTNEFLSILTVIDESPIITSNVNVAVENETVIITCSLNHNGSVSPAHTLRPYFYWTDSNGQNTSSYNDSTTDSTAVSLWTVTAGRETITSHTCHVDLQLNASTAPNYASNIPAVSKSASSPTLEVLYGPSIPVITSKPEVITNSDVPCGISILTCSSTGNPAPNYIWYESAENVILSRTNTLTLAEVNRNYKCEVNNTIQNIPYSASTTLTVLKDNCTSSVKCCEYPHDETTSVAREGCDNGTLCDCAHGYGGIILTCNAQTFPNASYMWIEPDGKITYSPVFDRVAGNGLHQCVAYFDKSLSNYTGDVPFSNGTNETDVGSCCETWVLVISFVIPYFGGNVIFLVVFLVLHFQLIGFKSLMDNKFSGTTTLTIVLLSIACVCFGLVIIPIAVTMAFCSSLKQGDVSSKPGGSIQMDGIPERSGSRQENGDSSAEVRNQQGGNVANAGPGIPVWSIVVMWCVGIVLLFPITFVCVYFVPCNQMRFEIS